jgi:hypothetical protein
MLVNKVKLFYREPSFLEGVARLCDISGVIRDRVAISHTHKQSRLSGTRFLTVKTQAGRHILAHHLPNYHANSFEVACSKATNKMSAVGNKMRPSIQSKLSATESTRTSL